MSESWEMPRDKHLEPQELGKLFAAAREAGLLVELMMTLSYHGALRVSELVHLKIPNFRFKDDMVLIMPVKKAPQPQLIEVELPHHVMQSVRRYITAGKLSQWLFPGNTTKCWLKRKCSGGHISKREVQKTFDELTQKIGIKRLSLGMHSLRHTRLIEVAQKTKDPRLVKEIGRHASVTMGDSYLRFVEARA